MNAMEGIEEYDIEAFVRDVTQAAPRPKSEVRLRLRTIVENERQLARRGMKLAALKELQTRLMTQDQLTLAGALYIIDEMLTENQ